MFHAPEQTPYPADQLQALLLRAKCPWIVLWRKSTGNAASLDSAHFISLDSQA
jgi:hypothetical protein